MLVIKRTQLAQLKERDFQNDVPSSRNARQLMEKMMKYNIPMLAVLCVLAIASPAAAQMVNGGTGVNGSPEAPIGTKSGGSNASMQAPGEAAAMAGAKQNTMDAKAMQSTAGTTVKHKRRKTSMTAPEGN